MASHELRTPLVPLTAYVDVMDKLVQEARAEAPSRWVEDVGRLVDRFRKQIGDLTRLTDDLLDVARLQTGTFTVERARVDLRRVVEEAREQAAQMPGAPPIRLNAAAEGLFVKGDEGRLVQATLNLLANAVRYARLGGPIDLRLKPDGAGRARIRCGTTDRESGPTTSEPVPPLLPRARLRGRRGRAWDWACSSASTSRSSAAAWSSLHAGRGRTVPHRAAAGDRTEGAARRPPATRGRAHAGAREKAARPRAGGLSATRGGGHAQRLGDGPHQRVGAERLAESGTGPQLLGRFAQHGLRRSRDHDGGRQRRGGHERLHQGGPAHVGRVRSSSSRSGRRSGAAAPARRGPCRPTARRSRAAQHHEQRLGGSASSSASRMRDDGGEASRRHGGSRSSFRPYHPLD
jgi:hypothetical protein